MYMMSEGEKRREGRAMPSAMLNRSHDVSYPDSGPGDTLARSWRDTASDGTPWQRCAAGYHFSSQHSRSPSKIVAAEQGMTVITEIAITQPYCSLPLIIRKLIHHIHSTSQGWTRAHPSEQSAARATKGFSSERVVNPPPQVSIKE